MGVLFLAALGTREGLARRRGGDSGTAAAGRGTPRLCLCMCMCLCLLCLCIDESAMSPLLPRLEALALAWTVDIAERAVTLCHADAHACTACTKTSAAASAAAVAAAAGGSAVVVAALLVPGADDVCHVVGVVADAELRSMLFASLIRKKPPFKLSLPFGHRRHDACARAGMQSGRTKLTRALCFAFITTDAASSSRERAIEISWLAVSW